MSKRPVALLLVLSLLAGCAAAPAMRPPPSVAAAPTAPASRESIGDDNLNAVAWTQTAIEHDLIYRAVYRSAGEKLLQALADPAWDALPREERRNTVAGLAPAVILDIDETVLDNSPYQARLVQQGGEYNEATWAEWCRERAARPLPGALEFTRLAARHGIAVFYLSNRAQDLADATLDNLRAAGFPVADGAFLGLGTLVDGCEQVGSEKTCRRERIARTHRVLLQVGDQLGDFLTVRVNTVDGRRSALAPYLDWVGERWFVLPNPTYGSWEPALFGNDWSRPPGARREAKIEALRSR